MPEEFGIVPRGLACCAHAPGSDSIFQARSGRERIAQQPDVQRALGGFDEAVQGGVDRRIVVVLRPAVPRSCGSRLAVGYDRLRKIMVDVSINTGEGKLDAGDRRLVAAVEQNLPALRRRLTGKRRLQRAKIQSRKLYVQPGEPCRIAGFTRRNPDFDSLRHLQIQLVEPLQAVPVYACLLYTSPS